MAWPTWFTPAAPVPANHSISPTGGPSALPSPSTKNDQAFKNSFFFRALLYNVRGIHKKPAKLSALSRLFSGYHLIALTETHIPHGNFGFPGWKVFASPRLLKRASGDTAGGVAFLLRGQLLQSLLKEYNEADGLPPECAALEFSAHVFDSEQPIVFILAYVTRPGKVTNAYKQKYGVDNLFFLISRFIVELRNRNKQVILLGDLNAYTTDAFGWNGRDALWSDVADIEFHRRVSACTRLSIGMGKIYSGSARAASFVF